MAILIILASFASITLGKLRLPSLIGFLLAGIIIANVLDFPEEANEIVEVFSNLGLIFLMFSIGMEIDIHKLKFQGRFAIVVTAVQIPMMFICGMVAGGFFGLDLVQSLVLGAILSGSSTAVVLAVQKSTNVLDQDSVDIIVLIMIIEDICQVIMLSILTPVLSGGNMSTDSLMVLIASIAVFMIACFTVGIKVIPQIINWIYDRTSSELISLFCIGMLFAFAWVANFVGLSVAIGAFLAGVFSGAARSKEPVEHFVDPLKILFMAMFFISVGMEVSVDSLVNNILMSVEIYIVFAVCMFLAVNIGYWVGNGDPRIGWISAASLCTMGEFAFIIAKEALNYNVLDQEFYSSIIGGAIISMFILSFLVKSSGNVYDRMDAKCPQTIHRGFKRLNSVRNSFYRGIEEVSSITREQFRIGLTRAYFITFLVLVIEVVFFLSYDPVTEWLYGHFGTMEEYQWRQIILAVNIIVLLEPCRRLAKFLRLAIYIMENGRKNVDEVEPRYYNSISTILVGALFTLVIVVIVPNGIDNLSHFVILGTIMIAVIILQGIKYIRDFTPNGP